MSEKFPMTPSGFVSMKAHLKRLKDVERPANSRAIEIARGHGDSRRTRITALPKRSRA
jgi:transcription elongation GreA/GreB family factor